MMRSVRAARGPKNSRPRRRPARRCAAGPGGLLVGGVARVPRTSRSTSPVPHRGQGRARAGRRGSGCPPLGVHSQGQPVHARAASVAPGEVSTTRDISEPSGPVVLIRRPPFGSVCRHSAALRDAGCRIRCPPRYASARARGGPTPVHPARGQIRSGSRRGAVRRQPRAWPLRGTRAAVPLHPGRGPVRPALWPRRRPAGRSGRR